VQKRLFAMSLIAVLVITLVIVLNSGAGLNAFAGTIPSPATSAPKLTFKDECGVAPKKGYARCLSLVSTTTIKAPAHETAGTLQPHAAGSPGQGAPYSPAALHAAYNLPNMAAKTQTVAIVDSNDDPNAESDLAVYRSNFGLTACTTSNGCFRKIDQNGGTNYPSPDTSWAGEISLDVDMVSAICNNCHILLVEANSASGTDLGTAVNTAVSLGANEVSNSYGGGEYSGDTSLCDTYYNHANVAITASTGDQGPIAESPAICPHVVAVGGTTLNSNGSETPWSGAGGACSAFISIPSWENSSVTGCSRRAVADVSAVADPSTGVSAYDTYQANGWYQDGGTSASSPIIAATYALAGGVSGDAASVPWSKYTSGCLGLVNGKTYNYQTGLGTPNGTGCFGGSGSTGNTGGGSTGSTGSTGSGSTYYKIINRNSGQALDISGLSTSNGGTAIQWPYNGGTNQQWQEVAANGGYKLVNRNSSLLLDDPNSATTKGTQLDQWSDSNSSNQQWNLVSTGDGYYYIVNQSNGLYVDVSGASTANGASVIEWSSNGGTNQQWQLVGV
jgi:Ricin-type beta-trefoil lectin domain-like